MPARWVHTRVDDAMYERMHAAAEREQRSLSNWMRLTITRALNETPQDGSVDLELQFAHFIARAYPEMAAANTALGALVRARLNDQERETQQA
jgi:hypothetical protein